MTLVADTLPNSSPNDSQTHLLPDPPHPAPDSTFNTDTNMTPAATLTSATITRRSQKTSRYQPQTDAFRWENWRHSIFKISPVPPHRSYLTNTEASGSHLPAHKATVNMFVESLQTEARLPDDTGVKHLERIAGDYNRKLGRKTEVYIVGADNDWVEVAVHSVGGIVDRTLRKARRSVASDS
jgi:hypothetical protein